MSKKVLRKKHEQQKTADRRAEIISNIAEKAREGRFGASEMKLFFMLIVSMSTKDFSKVTRCEASISSATNWQKGQYLSGLGLKQVNKLLRLANMPEDCKDALSSIMAYVLEGGQVEQMELMDEQILQTQTSEDAQEIQGQLRALSCRMDDQQRLIEDMHQSFRLSIEALNTAFPMLNLKVPDDPR